MAKNGYKILDSDMHVFEPHDLYLKYMDPSWGERIPRGAAAKTARSDQIYFGRQQAASSLRNASARALRPRPHADESSPGEAQVAHRYAKPLARDYDAISQLGAMDEEGLDVAVLFRTFPLHCDDSLEAEYANDLCRAWNNWMADFCKADPKRLRPSALITLHDVDLAVDETRRAISRIGRHWIVSRARAGQWPAYSRPLLRSGLARSGKTGRADLFSSGGESESRSSGASFQRPRNEAVLINAFRNPIELMLAVGSFCAGGVLERFPNLRVAFLEGNCSWLPWALYRLDERWEMRKGYCNEPMSLRPSDYFLRQCFISVDVEEDLVTDVIKRIGDDNVVISTDYPHADSHWPNAVNHFMAMDMPSGIAEENPLGQLRAAVRRRLR